MNCTVNEECVFLQMIQHCEFGACLTKADPEDWEAGKMICLGGMTY
jgi:hypothetical protein